MDRYAELLATTRVRNVLLGATRLRSPVDVVGHMLAVQAQEHAFSWWSVGQRTLEPNQADVIAAVDSADIVRVHALRPTWHYVRGEDLRWLQDLIGPRVLQSSAGWYRNHGVDEAFFTRTRSLIEEALTGGLAKTRDELKEMLTGAGVDVTGQRMAAALFDLELKAVICSGPVAGRKHTYALVEERLPKAPARTVEEATAELVRRYLRGHAPSTLKDLRWWSTLTLGQLRQAVEDVGDEVVTEEVEGTEYLWLADDPPRDAKVATERPDQGRFELLQVFDEVFVGYSETRGLLDPDGEFGAVLPIGFSKMMHVVLEGDRIAGRWRSDRKGTRMELTFQVTRPLGNDDRQALARAAAAYGAFVGAAAEVRLSADNTR